MRFDDTLGTVLAGDLGTPYGKQSAWRQIVDLIGRRRVPPDSRALAVLRHIRADVPPPVRAATARALEYADPPSSLIRLFALDELAIAIPVRQDKSVCACIALTFFSKVLRPEEAAERYLPDMRQTALQIQEQL